MAVRRRVRHPGTGIDRQSAGFTLLEMMVAMLLLAVIVTASVSLLFINIRGWDGLVSDSEKAFDRRLINDRLFDLLHYLSPMVWQSAGEKRLAFSAEAERIHFISRAPQQYRSGGLFEYLLVQERDSGNRANLVLYYAPYYPGRQAFVLPQSGQRRLLFADTGGVTFSYLGRKEANREADWWERWEETTDGYPLMIRMVFAHDGVEPDASSRYIRLLFDASGSGR